MKLFLDLVFRFYDSFVFSCSYVFGFAVLLYLSYIFECFELHNIVFKFISMYLLLCYKV